MADRSQLNSCSIIPSKKAKIKDVPGLQNHEGENQDVSAPVFTRKLRKAAVGTGCDIRLRVSVSGHPKPLMTWYHNEELIAPSEAQDSGGLWIRDCRTNDAGLYTCVASSELAEQRGSPSGDEDHSIRPFLDKYVCEALPVAGFWAASGAYSK
ncbi:hypothetical protein GOODEAATRI_028312 [Goodea atripinnis]|uniref:Ig-like domain-containing protein n=1 Tax=Goodea atripinnis TaxID=208336 RepID=A0ABV0PHV3_9TELE